MIVRESLACGTCEKAHTVRVGVGREHNGRHVHRFACRGCSEEIAISMVTSMQPRSAWIEPEENAELAPEVVGAPIVNLDANFLVPEDQQGLDRVMPRLQQQIALLRAAEATRARLGLPDGADRPLRDQDFAGEWDLLKRAWSLHRRGEAVLVRAQLKKANSTIYAPEPLADLPDWIWRFASVLGTPAYDGVLKEAVQALRPHHGSPELVRLRAHYRDVMLPGRGAKYFKVLQQYFAAYSEFVQLQFQVAAGLEIPADHKVASVGFAQTAMFYGNAFEVVTDLVDLLALLNNVIAGRAFDQFASLASLKDYYALDKARRSGPFAATPGLAGFVTETDNRLRNASHHAGIDFDAVTQTIHCRAGKGGQGAPWTLSYTEYLVRCVRLFLQVMTLLRLELVLSRDFQVDAPI